MKLRNKKTGEIGDGIKLVLDDKKLEIGTKDKIYTYDSIAELNDEWEDYEEPEGWYINMYGDIGSIGKDDEPLISYLKEIGNYFETKEEAEKAVEKLKAWKRLKNLGFRFIGKTCEYKSDKDFGSVFFEASADILSIYDDNVEFYDDLDLLFGGEECAEN